MRFSCFGNSKTVIWYTSLSICFNLILFLKYELQQQQDWEYLFILVKLTSCQKQTWTMLKQRCFPQRRINQK